MKKITKQLLFILIIIIAFIGVIIISQFYIKEQHKDVFEHTGKNIEKIQFKGAVMDSKIVKHGGRQYGIVCLKLDYSNIDNFYVFNESACLKIKDGKAIMSIGFVMQNEAKVKYIEVNMHGDKKERYFKEGGEVDEYEMTLASNGIIESDIKFCNE
ncbi:MAG: hypothetical protein J7574_04800 [Flavobacterium sp.]|uniref:hypothetical protein n=1 Tax=Flavobacterium sp. TaxID=239 RepID=UPI001B098E6A|nr:hypothetical protein [Flavobacterium sp.]MBO9583459.1 hypothetical protein [Flavobacterium sp.]